jgi:hypothetical protein
LDCERKAEVSATTLSDSRKTIMTVGVEPYRISFEGVNGNAGGMRGECEGKGILLGMKMGM